MPFYYFYYYYYYYSSSSSSSWENENVMVTAVSTHCQLLTCLTLCTKHSSVASPQNVSACCSPYCEIVSATTTTSTIDDISYNLVKRQLTWITNFLKTVLLFLQTFYLWLFYNYQQFCKLLSSTFCQLFIFIRIRMSEWMNVKYICRSCSVIIFVTICYVRIDITTRLALPPLPTLPSQPLVAAN